MTSSPAKEKSDEEELCESGVHRWAAAEAALSANFSADAVAGLSVSPDGLLGDLHGSPEYRAHLVGVLTKRAVAACG